MHTTAAASAISSGTSGALRTTVVAGLVAAAGCRTSARSAPASGGPVTSRCRAPRAGGAGQLRAVRAASEDGQHVGRGWFRGGALGARGAAGGTAAGEVAGGGRLLREGGRQLPGQARIVDVLVAVDPDRVEERGHEL